MEVATDFIQPRHEFRHYKHLLKELWLVIYSFTNVPDCSPVMWNCNKYYLMS
jgi:hypothetical protein